MNIRPRLILCLGLFALAACNHNDQVKVNITPTSIYNIDTVRAAIATADAHQAIWEKKLSGAAFLYKTKRLYGKAIDTVRQVIFSAPSARAYYELGSAYLEAKDFNQAVKALGIAEQLQYQSLPGVFYKLAVAYANCPNTDNLPLPEHTKTNEDAVQYYTRLAIQTGLVSPERFLNDSALAAYISSHHYQFFKAYNDAMTGRKDPMGSPFKEFLDGFGTLTLPANLDSNWLLSQKLSDKDFISMSFEPYVSEMRGARFAREDFSEYFYIGKVRETSNFIAVIYAVADAWDEESEDGDSGDGSDSKTTIQIKSTGGSALDTLPSVYYYLTTYSPAGTIIDKIRIAGQQSMLDPLKVAHINPDMTIEITDLDLVRSAESGTDNSTINPIMAIKAGLPERYHINNQGKLEKVTGPALSMR